MKDSFKKVIGTAAKILKWIYRFLFVIVIIYYGFLAVTDMIIKPIFTGEFPEPIKTIRYVFYEKIDEGDPVKMAAEAVSVSIPDLVAVYHKNAMEADKTYTGKILRLTGIIDSISRGSSFPGGSYHINLVSDDPGARFSDNVDIFLKKEEMLKLEDLSIGQIATIVGRCVNGGYPPMKIVDAFFESYSLSSQQVNQAYRLKIFSGITDKADVASHGRLEYELYNVSGGSFDDFKRFIFEQYIPILENGSEEAAGIYTFDLDDASWDEDNTALSDNVKRSMAEHQRNLSITHLTIGGSTDFYFNFHTSNGKYGFYTIRAFRK
jgi:hypothetical protein